MKMEYPHKRMLNILRILFAVVIGICAVFHVTGETTAGELFVEAESFNKHGGWKVDQQFTDIMGSPYLLAHGLGKPVADAETSLIFPEKGLYRLWVRTKDWVPDEHPGRFSVLVDGIDTGQTFGTLGTGWMWQDGGIIEINGESTELILRDLTGFDGRCDALYFTTDHDYTPPDGIDDIKELRRNLTGSKRTPRPAGEFDVVVVGGGIAGCSASLAAARLGLNVALIHDRPFLGGNASREVRVHTLGIDAPLVNELNTPHFPNGSPEFKGCDDHRHAVIEAENNISLFLEWRAFNVNTNGSMITSVDAKHIETGEELRFSAPIFIDSTGDGWIGYWSGAEYRMGRESSAEHGESLAPEHADSVTMGNTLLWNSRDAGAPVDFPEVPWAMDVAKDNVATKGEWFWEYGFHLDTIYDAEEIRDYLFRAIYGSFRNAKQVSGNENLELEWVAYIAGKRESRRLTGDYILTEKDVLALKQFPDAVAFEIREIDIHRPVTEQDAPKPKNDALAGLARYGGPVKKKTFKVYDFISVADYTPVEERYGIPFRCLYSVNIDNLMMAGRCFSASHVGLGSPRVMNTCGQMGVAVGTAAFLCKKYRTTPRGIYEFHLEEYMNLMSEQRGE